MNDITIHKEEVKDYVIDKIDLEIKASIPQKNRKQEDIDIQTTTYLFKALAYLDSAVSSLECKLIIKEKATIIDYENIINIIADLHKDINEQVNVLEIHEVTKEGLEKIKIKNDLFNVQNSRNYKNKAVIFQIADRIEIYSTSVVFSTISFKFQDTSKYWISNIRGTSENPIKVKLYEGTEEIDYKNIEDKLKSDYKKLIADVRSKVEQMIKNKSL